MIKQVWATKVLLEINPLLSHPIVVVKTGSDYLPAPIFSFNIK